MPLQDQLFWEVYVTPSHDNKWYVFVFLNSLMTFSKQSDIHFRCYKWKPLVIHIPNSIITLIYLVMYDTITLYVMIMSCSLICSSIGMKMPLPTNRTLERALEEVNNNGNSTNNENEK